MKGSTRSLVGFMCLVVGGMLVVAGVSAAQEPTGEPSPGPACPSAEGCTEEPQADEHADEPRTEETSSPPSDPGNDDGTDGSGGETPSAQGGADPAPVETASVSDDETARTRTISARSTLQASAAVAMVDNSFQPGTITVTPGTTVTWTNQGTNPHSATADDGSFDSGMVNSGGTYSFTFDTPGSYAYHCEFHPPDMVGSVVVRSASSSGGGGGGASTNDPGGAPSSSGDDEDAVEGAGAIDGPLPATGPERPWWLGLGLALILLGTALLRYPERRDERSAG